MRKDIWLYAQNVILECTHLRLKVKIYRLPCDQQVSIDCRQVTEFERMITGHRVTALEALGAHQVRIAIGKDVKVNAAIVLVREERVVKCRRLASKLLILWIFQYTVHNQVG